MIDVVVLGAGVIGLSCARELSDRGFKVAVVARDLPEDVNSVGFASPWAGCNWFSFEADGSTESAGFDRLTYGKLEKVAQNHPDLVQRIPFYDVWDLPKPPSKVWFEDLVGGFADVSGQALPGNLKYGHKFFSYIINAPAYLSHLGNEVRSRNIPIFQHRIAALDEAYNLPFIGSVKLAVNALGLGSRTLIGVEDSTMYPASGQTVLVRAPLVKTCIMHVEGFMATGKPGEKPPPMPAYIIPRPGPDGHVILGGCYLKDNWDTQPNLDEAKRILQACYNLEPRLAGENGQSWRDIEVISHNVGLRPARAAGARVELEKREVGQGSKGSDRRDIAPRGGRFGIKREVAVVHAYGVGSAGYQSSLGVADKVANLAMTYLPTPARL